MLEQKSQLLQFILTFFLGPIGLLYSSVGWGLVLLIIGGSLFWTGVVPAICWFLSILIGFQKVSNHNYNIQQLESRFYVRPQAAPEKNEFIKNGVIVYVLMLLLVYIAWGLGLPGMIETMIGPYF